MKDMLGFLRELLKSRIAKWLILLYGLFGFIVTVLDEFFPRYSDKLKLYYLLPKWRWDIWMIIALSIAIVVLTEEAYVLWKEKTIPKPTATTAPQVILDFKPAINDRPTKRKRYLILRNVGPSVAFNSRVEPFKVGDFSVSCDPVDHLQQGCASAELTAEIRTSHEVRKPCLVELDPLLQFSQPNDSLPLFISYIDLNGGKYRAEYSCRFKSGINECQLELKGVSTVDSVKPGPHP